MISEGINVIESVLTLIETRAASEIYRKKECSSNFDAFLKTLIWRLFERIY